MLHGPADVDEQLQPLAVRQADFVAVVGDGDAPDEFHHEERPAAVGRAGIEHPGDVGVLHQRQGLPFGFEAGDDFFGVHPRLEDFDGDHPADRCGLLGHEDGPERPLTDLLQQLVGADHCTRRFGDGLAAGKRRHGPVGPAEEVGGVVVCCEQRFDLGPKVEIVAADVVKPCAAFGRRVDFDDGGEDVFELRRDRVHWPTLLLVKDSAYSSRDGCQKSCRILENLRIHSLSA